MMTFMDAETFCNENLRRFFNNAYCLHVQASTKQNTNLITLSFQIAPIVNGKVQFQGADNFQLSAHELTSLGRYLLMRTDKKISFPYHNGKTLQFECSDKGINVQIIKKGALASFMVPHNEVFSLCGIVVSTIARRELIDSTVVMTMLRNGF